MLALRKGAIVVFVVALGYLIMALQARSADIVPGAGLESGLPATAVLLH